ncbi:amino acid adenylation domain-containing protein [Chryseobacterium sp. CBSDS_008]|uniref:amino acid adenylation domain-containing protein n=1 Tax=Chryseobacterium sp. CBSDS_008 TaxID=3415265 RepID=UPI003CF57E82
MEKLNSSLIRFINHNLIVNCNIININGELFWKSRPLISDHSCLLIYFSRPPDSDELLELVLQPFDLINDQLVRFYIIRLDDEKYRIIYVFSNILIDRLTDDFLYSELSKYYNNTSYYNPVTLNEQVNLLQELNTEVRNILDERKEIISDFWEKQLKNIQNPGFKFLEVCNDRSISSPSFYINPLKELHFEFSEEVLFRTKLLTDTYKMTPYAYGQLILAILLHRISGVENLVISYPVSIKKPQNYIFGSHVNTIVKGYYFNSNSILEDLIDQNMDYLNDLWNTKADYLPVSELIQYAPIPEIFEYNFSQTSFKDLYINYEGVTDITVNHQLSLALSSKVSFEQEIKNDTLHYRIVFNRAELNAELVMNFVELYKHLFISILDDLLKHKTNRLISGYHLLNYEMDYRMVHLHNNTIKPYDTGSTVHRLFEEQAFRTPDHTALVYGEERMSYRDVNEKSNQLAHYLIQRFDIRPDELVPVCFRRSEQMLIGILGVLKAGGAYVPIDPGYPVERIGHILSDTCSRIVLGDSSTVTRLYEYTPGPEGAVPVILNLDDKQVAEGINRCYIENPVTETGPTHLAYVIYTSGTTGSPKGVMVEHSGVVNLVDFMIQSHHFKEYTHVGCYSNYVFDAFVNEVFPVLCHGNTLWLFSNELRTSVIALSRYIKTHGIEVSFIPPVLLKELLPDTGLKLIFAGGENFPDIDRTSYPDIILLNEYGPTESTVCATYHHYHEDGNSLNIGRPIGNTTVYVLDSYLRPVPMGAVGELYIGGVGVSRGYLNLPELTAERFLVNPFQTQDERALGYNGRLYKTGDLVRFLPCGDLEYLGRNDSQLKIRGYRIEPGEVESAILRLRGIRQAVVVGRENSMGVKYLAAYYVSDTALESSEISLVLSDFLPDYMVPSAYVHMASLPVTITGKLDRRSLPEPLFTGDTQYVGPQTALQEQLVWIYGSVLGIDPDHISIHDDFFRLGGNSIMAIKVISKLHQLGIYARAPMVFSHKSIACLSYALEGLHESGFEVIQPVRVQDGGAQCLSFGQERLWFIENYQGSHAYNIPMVLHLDRKITLSFLQDALNLLLERHEVLRSLIQTRADGSGYQRVSEQKLELILVKAGSLEDFEQALSKAMNERFNLQEELPIRVKVLEYEDEYYLSVVIHHIAFDGWSIDIFLREVNSMYQSLCSGILSVLPSLPFQYKDFALWQREYVTGEVLSGQLDYWLGELSGFETLNLPLDFDRPSKVRYEGKTLGFSVSFAISSRLRSLSRDLGVSLYSVMLSGYYLMLSSYCAQSDIVVGTPVANRHYPGLENLIGFFVNTLVLRQSLDFNQNIQDFIRGVSSCVLRGQVHQDLPFEKLVDALKVEKDPSRHPLFQVMFGLQGFESGAKEYGEGCFFHSFESGPLNEASRFDLTTMIDDRGEELSGTFNFASSLFMDSTIENMITTYQYILEQLGDLSHRGSSQVKLSDIRWIKEEDGPAPGLAGIYSAYDTGSTVHRLFEEQAFRTPDHTALVYGEERMSYRDVNEKSNQLAHYLIQRFDIRPDELVPVCFRRSEQMLIGILGVLKAGGAYVPIDPGYPVERIGHILSDTCSRIVLGDSSTVTRLYEYTPGPEGAVPVILNLDDKQVAEGINRCYIENPVTETGPTHLAYVIYTSGTTGSPKGVMVEHSGVVNLIEQQALLLNLEEVLYRSQQKNVLWYSDYVFDAHIWEVYSTLALGHTLHLVTGEGRMNIEMLQQYMSQNNIKMATIPPALLNREVILPIDKLIVAGDITNSEIMECYRKHGIDVVNAYGPTESTVCATYHHYHEDGNPLNIGRPIGNTTVYVLDSYLRPVPMGAVGELYIGGVGVSRGYLNLPELTAERFLVNPFQTQDERALGYNGRLYKTGDLVRFLPCGDLEYLGRNDSQLKIRGYRIEPGEVESAILRLRGIRQAVVVGRENSMGVKYLAAYYVSDTALESSELSLVLSDFLPDYMVPSAYVHMASLPVTITGKLDRRSLPEPLFTGDTQYVGPQTALQEQLVWIYGSVLGIDPDHISIHDDFFRLGGNSIMAIKLIVRIRQDLDRQINVSALYDHKSIAELAHVLEQSHHEEASRIRRLQVRHVEDQYLSFAQEGLWFIDQYKGGNNAYNIPMIFRIDQTVNLSILIESLSILMQRHEILRTLLLTSSDGTGYQQVSDLSLELSTREVADFNDLENELYMHANKVFHLSQELPVSVRIFANNHNYYLSVVFHHIAFDGWSAEIFSRELYLIYQALFSNDRWQLPVLEFQYKDYALWQRDYLKNYVSDQLGYWKSLLSNFETLYLPLDFKRPAETSYEGNSISFTIPSQTSSDLRSLAKNLGVSLYSVMLSGYYLTLSSYSGQNDIVVGTPVANRHYPGLENMIGLFVNTLVLRETIDYKTDIRLFIKKVFSSVSKAQINQDLPFEKLVEALDIEYDSSRHPVFQVMFGFESFTPLPIGVFNGSSFLHPFEGRVLYDAAKFDLTTIIDDTGEDLSGTFNYAKSLYKESTIEGMLSTYLYLLEQIAVSISDGTETKLADLQLLRSEDYERLSECNEAYSVYNTKTTIHSLFERQVSRTPDRTALVYRNTRLSYQELNEKSNQLAYYLLKEYEIKPNELIPLCLNRSEQMLIGILGVLKAGGAYVPIDPGYPVEWIGHILSDTGAHLVITEEAMLDRLGSEVSDVICLDDNKIIKKLSSCKTDNPLLEVGSVNLAYVIYTSGTSGKPKGVLIEHTSVVNLIEEIRSVYSFCETGRLSAYTSYVFDVSVSEFFSALLYGNELHLFDEHTKKDAGLVSEYLLAHHITHTYLPPAMLSLLPRKEFPSLQTIIHAGEPCDEETEKYWSQHKNVYNLYGPTESTIYVTSKQIGYPDGNPLNIGRPIGNTTVYVLDSYLRPVPMGAVGELYIGGVGVSRGYLNLPELTAERFLVNPFQTQDERALGYNGRLYKTGDLVRFLPCGDLEYLGRNDSQLKIRGYRIEPGEVESAILRLRGIRQAVVVGRENSMGVKYLAAYYVSDTALESSEISLVLSDFLPDYMVPSAYVHMASLPVTITGKLDRRSLPEPLFTGDTQYVGPQTALQEQLVWIYGSVLGIDPDHISIHDDFFRLGGNSIMAIKVISKLHQLGIYARAPMVFSHKSIACLSYALEGLHESGFEVIQPVRVQDGGAQCLSFGQERLWFIENYQGSHAYNIPMVLHLDRKITLSFLQDALNLLLERHEVLRSLIQTRADGSGYQRVSEQKLELILVKAGSLEDFEQALSKAMNERFNLQEELPIRVKVLEYEDEYYLSVVIHHIAFDGWSIDIFLREVNSMYQSLCSGILSVLPSLPFQYKDFALWQREYVTGEVLSGQLDYWLGELSGFETLNLPLDFDRPSKVRYEGKTLGFSVSFAISSRLRSLSRDLGVSLYSVMLSGYYLMLSSYCAQSDIVVGTPVANRHYPGLENLIGFFVNTLVLRQSLDFNQNIQDFIRGVSSCVLRGQVHQDLPFEKLVDALKVEKDPSRHPLFQVMFGLQGFESGAKEYGEGCFFHSFESGPLNEASRFDLTTMIDDRGEELSGTFNFASSLFMDSTIENMITTYQYILEQLGDLSHRGSSQVKLSDIRWIKEEDGPAPGLAGIYSAYDTGSTVHRLFEEQAFRTPDHTALVYGEERMSYRDVNEKSNQLAHYLIQRFDIRPDELVPVCFRRSEQMLIGILGVLKAGGAYVPIDPGYPVERIGHILSDTCSRIVLGDSSTVTRLYEYTPGPEGAVPVILNLDDKQVAEGINRCYIENPVTETGPTHLAYVIYTSGTTGSPKGVMVEHSGVVNLVDFMIQSHHFKEYTHVGCYSNYVFDAFVNEVFPVLCHGNTLWLFSNELRTSVIALSRYIKTHGIEVSFIPPVLLKELLPDTGLKLIFAGGENFPDIDRTSYPDIILLNEYGPTESTVCATYHHYHEDGNSLNIGRPIGNTTVYVLDSYLRPVPMGAVGELYIGGVGVSRGYLNLPELTAERFLVNPFQTQDERALGYNGRLYKTGDLVRFLPCGDLEYLGRNDSQLKIRGYRIEPGEVESAILRLRGIRQAVVVGRENSMGVKYLAAYYVSDTALESSEISLVLSDFLPDYMVPSAYVHMASLPVTITGKLDRRSLPEPLFTGDTQYVGPQTALQEQLVWIYGSVLGIDPDHISIHDDFFRLGGNSIMAIKLVNTIYRQTGLQPKVIDVFNERTIDKLSLIMTHSESEYRPVVTLNHAKDKPNVFMIHPGGMGCEVYKGLAERLKSDYQCYGLDSYNLYNNEKISNLHYLATYYLNHIEVLQKSNGQKEYILIGWCLGGQIALEIASILESRGHKDITVLMLDTILRAEDAELMSLSSTPSDEEISEEFQAPVDSETFFAAKKFLLAEHCIVGQKISARLKFTKMILLKAMVKGEKQDQQIFDHIYRLAFNNVDKIIERPDLLMLHPVEASHQEIIKEEEIIIDFIKKHSLIFTKQ